MRMCLSKNKLLHFEVVKFYAYVILMQKIQLNNQIIGMGHFRIAYYSGIIHNSYNQIQNTESNSIFKSPYFAKRFRIKPAIAVTRIYLKK